MRNRRRVRQMKVSTNLSFSSSSSPRSNLGGFSSRRRKNSNSNNMDEKKSYFCVQLQRRPTTTTFVGSIFLFFLVVISPLPPPPAAEALIPEFLSYKTCFEAPPDFSGCMTNVTADIGERVVLNCQVDPRCVIQYLNWYHEPEIAIVSGDEVGDGTGGHVTIAYGEKRLIKTGRSSGEPYMHTINDVQHSDLGRYACVIANVRGKRECSAYLSLRSGGSRALMTSTFALTLPTMLMTTIYQWPSL